MDNKTKKSKFGDVSKWLPNVYYICMIGSLVFIIAQVMYTKDSITESGKWERAKITMENVEFLKSRVWSTDLRGKLSTDYRIPDFTENLFLTDTIFNAYLQIYDNDSASVLSAMGYLSNHLDAFAYPVIMGYASESGSYNLAGSTYTNWCLKVSPVLTQTNSDDVSIMLYRLWQTRQDISSLTAIKKEPEALNLPQLIFYSHIKPEDIDSEIKKLRKKLKSIQKQIEKFRKANSD